MEHGNDEFEEETQGREGGETGGGVMTTESREKFMMELKCLNSDEDGQSLQFVFVVWANEQKPNSNETK